MYAAGFTFDKLIKLRRNCGSDDKTIAKKNGILEVMNLEK